MAILYIYVLLYFSLSKLLCIVYISLSTQFTNVAVGRIIQFGGPQIADPWFKVSVYICVCSMQ